MIKHKLMEKMSHRWL